MYGGIGISAPSLHRESTDSLIPNSPETVFWLQVGFKHTTLFPVDECSATELLTVVMFLLLCACCRKQVSETDSPASEQRRPKKTPSLRPAPPNIPLAPSRQPLLSPNDRGTDTDDGEGDTPTRHYVLTDEATLLHTWLAFTCVHECVVHDCWVLFPTYNVHVHVHILVYVSRKVGEIAICFMYTHM